MISELPIRVLIAKPGLDGHDKGAKIVALALKEAGMEVIYTGIRQTVDSIVKEAIEEGVDVIGLSILSGAHLSICSELIKKIGKRHRQETLVVVGGFIPRKDIPRLKTIGVAEVFRPNSKTDKIVDFIRTKVSWMRENKTQ